MFRTSVALASCLAVMACSVPEQTTEEVVPEPSPSVEVRVPSPSPEPVADAVPVAEPSATPSPVVVAEPTANTPEEPEPVLVPDCSTGVFKQGGLILCRNGEPGAVVKLNGKAVAKFDDTGRASIGLAQHADLTANISMVSNEETYTEAYEIEPRQDSVRNLTLNCDVIDARTPEQKEHAGRAWVWKQDAFKTLNEGDGFWNGVDAPAEAPTSSPFGPTSKYRGVSETTGEPCDKTSVHRGQDFATPTGTPLLAPADGVVTLAAQLYYEGDTIFVDHGQGLVSIFMHLSEFDVEPGDVVKAGDVIGKTGNTGRSTGPHLHWGIKWRNTATDNRDGDFYIDPALLLDLKVEE